ncbi:mycofactocin biosynthesis peptidyl-dipeptidase MftE [Aurantimicrobium minutum]|uniref:mycofactocin biosynthesis peptidyl-dipeptidase MftE n=1 Tax=Aurantimicrobium minutum TaxID=708131 RepID=UPI00247419D1|nr:mycofactocin biosynthesis peptidyl-dipeptidase MftE [Aurantimicrobium minutum]MDH6536145.1 mycofactocin system creatininase family protein [Aurantimicrobium minutum]
MVDLATSRWPELGSPDVVLIPLGSTEQHGPHLPFETDTVIAVSVAEALAAELAFSEVFAVVAPALAIGASGEHQDFPGTLSMGNEALRHVVLELARSVKTWSPRVVFVNGHGGNAPVLADVVSQLVDEGHKAIWVSCGVPGQDAHAGREETSLMLYLAPGTVDMSRAEAGAEQSIQELLPRLRTEGVRGVSSNGVLGNPQGATRAEGKDLLEQMTSAVAAKVRDWMGVSP